jgi:ectoine hydroxylase-related dioxygenase (phytanoyl-CoA dioxygenase family)
MLNKKRINEFNKNGFIIIKNFVKKREIKKIFDQMDSVLNTIFKFNKIKFNKKMSIDEKYFLLKKKKPILKSHFYDSIRILDSFNNIVYSERITKDIKKILNTNTVFVTNSRLRTDHKKEKASLAFHQELNNISTGSALVFCPFVKVNKKTGTLCIIPGSHKHGHLIFKDSEIAVAPGHKTGVVEKILKGKEKLDYKNPIVQKLFSKENIVIPSLNPGDAVVFNNFLFHGSTHYVGKGLRWTLLANFHRINKTPYILKENFKASEEYPFEMGLPMRICYKENLNKII